MSFYIGQPPDFIVIVKRRCSKKPLAVITPQVLSTAKPGELIKFGITRNISCSCTHGKRYSAAEGNIKTKGSSIVLERPVGLRKVLCITCFSCKTPSFCWNYRVIQMEITVIDVCTGEILFVENR